MAGDSSNTTYKWAGNGDIVQVDTRKDHDKSVAYLHASENAPHLYQLREIFRGKGWTVSSAMHDGKPVLRITGMDSEGNLIDFLQQGGYAQGQPQIIHQDAEYTSKFSALTRDTLHASGAFYLLGDALMFYSGLKQGKNLGQMGTGIAFGAGDIAFMAFGGHNEQQEFTSLLKSLKKHLNEKGIEIPRGAAINTETMAKPGGFLEHVHGFLVEYINPIKIMAEILGGALYLHAGLAKPDAKHPDRVTNPRKQASGVVIMTGWLAALLIKEKKIDQEEYNKAGVLKKAWMKVQSSPLSLAGGAGLIHNALTIVGAVEARNALKKGNMQKGTPYWKWDMLAIVAGMIPANILFAISKKKGTRSDAIESNTLMQDINGIAVQILEQQPPAEREAAFNEIVDFLAARPEVKGTKTEIAGKLQQEMEELKRTNPWFIATPEQEKAMQGTFSHQERLQMPEQSAPIGTAR